MDQLGLYGPRVIGEEQAAREARTIVRQAHIYGPRVVDPDPNDEPSVGTIVPAAAANTPPAPLLPPSTPAASMPAGNTPVPNNTPPNTPGQMSIAELGKALTTNPGNFDALLSGETQRIEGPRAGALHLFKQMEENRTGGARNDVIEFIDALTAARKNNAPPATE